MNVTPTGQAGDHALLSRDAQDCLEMLRIAIADLNSSIEKYRNARQAEDGKASGYASYTLLQVQDCPAYLHSLEGWPEVKAMTEHDLEDVKRNGATRTPITDFWTSSKDHPLAHYQTNPPCDPPKVYGQTLTLQSHFYEAEFLGSAHTATFETIKRLEARIKTDWIEGEKPKSGDRGVDDADKREPKLFYARCLPIIQSPGMGKTRLLRELGKLRDQNGQDRVFVFTLCLRPDFDGSDACVPETDKVVRDFLNQDASQWGIFVDWKRWPITVHVLLQALFEGIRAILEQADGQEAWQDLCNPDTPYKRQLRSGFLSKITRHASHLRQDAFAPLELRDGGRDVCHDEAIRETAWRALAAAQRVREKLREGDWFVLALDEAWGICPKHLNASRTYWDNPERVTADCLEIIIRVFSNFHPHGHNRISKHLPRPERFWLAFTDTDPCFADLPPYHASSGDYWRSTGRSAFGENKNVPPCFPVHMNLQLEEPSFASRLLQSTPLEASIDHVLLQTGRPYWQSLLSVQREDATAPSGHWPPLEAGTQSLATPECVLEQLLAWSKSPTASTLDRERSEILLCQRLAIVPAKVSREFYDSSSGQSPKARVQQHLGVAVSPPDWNKKLEVAVPPEPLVTKAATGFFRTNGRDSKGNELVTLADATVWKTAWESFAKDAEKRQPWHLFSLADPDAIEALVSQAILCMAHDLAARPAAYEHESQPEMAFLGQSAFVHVEAFMAKYVAASLPEELVRDLTPNAWMNFERFTRTDRLDFDRRDLVIAFFLRMAIAALPGQSGYDLIIPIYCGPLDEAFHPSHLTWAEVQLKRRHAKPARGIRAQSIEYGDFLADDEQARVTPFSAFEPRVPPIVIQLDMAPALGAIEARDVRVVSNAPQEKKCWYVELPPFEQKHHPVLQELWPGGDFRPLRKECKNTASTWQSEMQAHNRKSLTGEAVLRR